MFDLDVEISVTDGPGRVSIELPVDLAARIPLLPGPRYNICHACLWEVAPDEECNCGQPGGLRYVAQPIEQTDQEGQHG